MRPVILVQIDPVVGQCCDYKEAREVRIRLDPLGRRRSPNARLMKRRNVRVVRKALAIFSDVPRLTGNLNECIAGRPEEGCRMQPFVDLGQLPVSFQLVSDTERYRDERPSDILEEGASVLGGVGDLEMLDVLQTGEGVAYLVVTCKKVIDVPQLEIFDVRSLEDALR